jgi:hypothetical protein
MLNQRIALTLRHESCGTLPTNVVCIFAINHSGNSFARHPTHATKESFRHCWPHHSGHMHGALDRILNMGGSALIPRCLIAHSAVYFRSSATKATTSKRGPRNPFTPAQLFVGPRSILRVTRRPAKSHSHRSNRTFPALAHCYSCFNPVRRGRAYIPRRLQWDIVQQS